MKRLSYSCSVAILQCKRSLALMAADSLLKRRAFFTAGKRRLTEARFPACKKASREKAGSGQQDWLQKKTDSFRYRFSFWYYRLFF